MTQRLRELIELRRHAWTGVQCCQAFLMAGFDDKENYWELDLAWEHYEVIRSAVCDQIHRERSTRR